MWTTIIGKGFSCPQITQISQIVLLITAKNNDYYTSPPLRGGDQERSDEEEGEFRPQILSDNGRGDSPLVGERFWL